MTIDLRSYLDLLTREQRIEFLQDLLHEVKFELRLSSLTDFEAEQLANVDSLSEEQRKKADTLSEARREKYFAGLARATYFHQCAWSNWLNGTDEYKPFTPSEEYADLV